MLKNEYRLNQIKTDKDIVSLSKAQFPGSHCPLFGAIMTASYIEDLTILVVGTEECTYYGKDFAMLRQNGKDRVYSAVLEQHDITFGCEDDLREIIKKIDEEEKPKALMIITTCVIELIGDDVESILYSMKDEVDTKLMIVKTEHFKHNSHISGMKSAFESMAGYMVPSQTSKKQVNVLGFKYSGIEDSELFHLLKEHDIEIALTIPTKVSIEQIEKAAQAAVNIVVDDTALDLAKAMEHDFHIPYVDFKMTPEPAVIENAYMELGNLLNINIDSFIAKEKVKITKDIEKAKEKLKGKKFIYGNTPFDNFACSKFFMDLGMEPEIIHCRELLPHHMPIIEEILESDMNPYILRMANIAPLRRIYHELDVDYFFGHESPMILSKNGITQVVLDSCAAKIGFQKCSEAINGILEEKGMFSLMMGNKKHGDTSAIEEKGKEVSEIEAFREKVKRMKKIPEPMKKMLLQMGNVPEAMREGIMKMDDDANMESMMMGHGKGGRR